MHYGCICLFGYFGVAGWLRRVVFVGALVACTQQNMENRLRARWDDDAKSLPARIGTTAAAQGQRECRNDDNNRNSARN